MSQVIIKVPKDDYINYKNFYHLFWNKKRQTSVRVLTSRIYCSEKNYGISVLSV